MKKRLCFNIVLSLLLSVFLVGCGNEATSNESAEDKNIENENVEETVHEHSYVYTTSNDGTHAITCSSEGCEYSESASCQYASDYVCESCGHMHEHIYAYAANNDGTHIITCSSEGCDYSVSENCIYSEEYICESCGFIHEHSLTVTGNNDGTHNTACVECGFSENSLCVLNEEYACTECAWMHEHVFTYESAGDGTHNVTCSFECCPYTNIENCTNSDYLCVTCGYEFPKWVVKEKEAKTYYARKKLNVYSEPSADSEVIKTLSVDDSIVCVGVVREYKGERVWFYQTDEGYFVEQDSKPKASGLKNLCLAKSNQVYVFEFYPRIQDYDNLKFEAVYNSIDEALIDLTGHDREWYKTNWEYDPLDMWGRDVYHSPKRVVEYRTTEDGYTFPSKYVSDGTIYIDKDGVVSSYAYGAFDEEGNYDENRGVIYRFDY